MPDFDLHVATEIGFSADLEQELKSMGLQHDKLLNRHVDFYDGFQVSSCPLIGLHMTKKYDGMSISAAREKIRHDLIKVEILLKGYQMAGYAHGEVTRDGCDIILKGNGSFNGTTVWPVKPFTLTMSHMDKKWDIHIAISPDNMPAKLAAILEGSGMYSIDLMKNRNGCDRVFRIFTVQGVSNAREGMKLYLVLRKWFQEAQTPYVEMKLETYLGMIRVGHTNIVPPTITHVMFL